MSSQARFVLLFETSGDQEVVNKIGAVGAAGKQAATDLQALQGIQDPFEPIATGADAAIAPVENVGTAVTDTAGTMTELTTEGEAAATGMEEFGTQTEGAASKTESFSSSMTTMTGAITAIGGAIGSTVSALFRYQDIQLKVQKAQLTSARATEMSRKAEEGLDKVLATATSNTANIAAARDRLAKAQGNMNKLMDQGVTSGSAFEAAQNEVTAAQKSLSAEFAKGGGDIAKLTDAMEKSEINSSKMVVSLNNLEKANRQAQQGTLDLVFGFGSLAGSFTQIIGSAGKWGTAAKAMKTGFMDLVSWIGRGGLSLGAFAGAVKIAAVALGGLILVIAAVLEAYQLFRGIPKIFDLINGAIEGNVKKMIDAQIQMMELAKDAAKFSPLGAVQIPLYDEVIKKLKESAKARQIEIDTKGQDEAATSGLMQILRKLPPQYKDIINELVGFTAISEEVNTGAGEGIQLQSRFAGSVRLAGTAAATAGEGLTTLGDSYSEAADAAEVASRLQSRFADSARLTGSGFKSLGDQLTETIGKIDEAKGTIPDYIDTVTGAITEGNQKFYESGQALEDNLSTEEKAVRSLADETIQAKDAFKEASEAGDQWAESLYLQAVALESEITAMQDVNNQQKATKVALLEVTKAYEESNQAVRDSNAIIADQSKVRELVDTAINNEIVSLNEEAVALESRNAIAKNTEIQDKRLAIAKAEGIVSANEFIAALDEEAATQKTYEAALRKTVQAYGLFGSATVQSAEQLEQFLQVAAGSPQALGALASEIGKLAQEATKFLEFGGEEDELFGDWKVSDKLPDEIKDMMSRADFAFIEGRAQLERTMESLGPLTGVKLSRALLEGGEEGLNVLRKFGPQAADIIRQSVDTMTPSIAELANAYSALGNVTDATAIPAMQRVVTAMENAQDPTADLKMAMSDLAVKTGQGFEPIAQMAGGLSQLQGAADRAGKPIKDLTLSLAEMNTVTIKETGQKFAELNGQMVEIKPAAGTAGSALAGLGVDATDAHTKLTALHTILTLIPQITVAPHIDVDTTDAYTKLSALHQALTAINSISLNAIKITVDASDAHGKLTALHSALSAINSMTLRPIPIQVNHTQAMSAFNAVKSGSASAGAAMASFSSKAVSSFNKTGAGATTMANKVKNASSSMKSALSSAASSASSFASKCVSSFNKVGSSATSNASKVRNLASAISKLKSKTITITTKYVTSGRPRGGLQHGGAFIADSPTTIGGMKMGEHYKPELVTVTPLTNPNSLDKTITVNTPRGGGGGSKEVVIPVTLMLDNKVLIRTVRRGLVEEVSGAM